MGWLRGYHDHRAGNRYHDQGRPLKKDYSRFKMLNFRILENELKHGHELKRTRTRTRTRHGHGLTRRRFAKFGLNSGGREARRREKRKINAHSLSLKIPKKLFFSSRVFPYCVY